MAGFGGRACARPKICIPRFKNGRAEGHPSEALPVPSIETRDFPLCLPIGGAFF